MTERKGDAGYAEQWCVHYRYNHVVKPGESDTCNAGVNYEAWRGMPHDRKPCFLDHGKSRPDAILCPSLRLPTPREIADHKAWITGGMQKIATVMGGIGEWRARHRGKSAADVIECPACKGNLHLSIAAYNGHVRAHCETPECVSWIE
jgi:hypothetical protein